MPAFTQSGIDFPKYISVKNAPTNASPAPLVSTRFPDNYGTSNV